MRSYSSRYQKTAITQPEAQGVKEEQHGEREGAVKEIQVLSFCLPNPRGPCPSLPPESHVSVNVPPLFLKPLRTVKGCGLVSAYLQSNKLGFCHVSCLAEVPCLAEDVRLLCQDKELYCSGQSKQNEHLHLLHKFHNRVCNKIWTQMDTTQTVGVQETLYLGNHCFIMSPILFSKAKF